MQLIENILTMYKPGDGHVMVLTASVRTLDHLLYALQLDSDIITAPYKILKQWAERGMLVPGKEYKYDAGKMSAIPYREIALDKNWQTYDLRHDLTDTGMEKFSADWRSLFE
jgi:transaldolase